MYSKIKYCISTITAILSALLGQFWFLFVFLVVLNIIDYITGILKARYLGIESSRKATKGFIKKFLMWCLVALSFGLGIALRQIGEAIGVNLDWMICLGYFMIMHCIVNEIRSILENIVQCDRGDLVPNWLIRGLEVAQKITDKKANSIIDKFDKEE